MSILWLVIGLAILFVVLWDAFESIVLPRRVTRRVRLTRLFYRGLWTPWRVMAKAAHSRKRQETILGFFGPLSLILLLGMWATGLIFGFGIVLWASREMIHSPEQTPTFATYLYLSGTTFFTLGLGDITPLSPWSRALAVVEAGIGFGFLAIVIGYLPVIYGAFSRREVSISLLDARAGSPPSALELLRRHSEDGGLLELHRLLREWERWCAELLESHLSYPVLCFYRSQHSNQSWLATLTTILDTCSLIIVGIEGTSARQARLTFAMARHAVVDLAQVVGQAPLINDPVERLTASDLALVRMRLKESGMALAEGEEADRLFSDMRKKYEPYVEALCDYLVLPRPVWVTAEHIPDNWQTSRWERTTGSLAAASHHSRSAHHF
jgi:hypothetical protein